MFNIARWFTPREVKDVFEAEGKHYITLWMEAEYLGGEPRLAAEYEASEIGWFRWDALPEPLFLSLRNLVEGRVVASCRIRGQGIA